MEREYKLAIVSGDYKCVERSLTRKFVAVNDPFHSGIRPLNLALLWSQATVARMLLDFGAKVNDEDSFRYDERQKCPIHYAAQSGTIEIVEVRGCSGSG